MDTGDTSIIGAMVSIVTNVFVPILTFIFDFSNPIGATISVVLLLSIIGGIAYAFMHK